jgi:hypothetical protein
MAKLYAELTGHETPRKVSKSSNTRLKLDVYQGNDLIGQLCAYPITEESKGHRITWQCMIGGGHCEKVMIQDTDLLK